MLGLPRLVVVAGIVGFAMVCVLAQTPFGRHGVARGVGVAAAFRNKRLGTEDV